MATHSELPGNSYKEREQRQKSIEAVANGKIRPASTGKQLKEAMVVTDGDTVKSYVLLDVLVPTLKDAVVSVVTGVIQLLAYGDARSTGHVSKSSASYVNYNDYSNQKSPRNRRQTVHGRGGVAIDDVLFASETEARSVLDSLVDLTMQYGEARVADYYELSGVDYSYTDNGYGWSELSTARVIRDRRGWVIDLPRARRLD